MNKYKKYLDDMKNSAIFQDINTDQLLSLLNKFDFPICQSKAGGKRVGMPRNGFQIALQSYPKTENEKLRFKYDMPTFGACGFLMGEIPSLSRLRDGIKFPPVGSMKFPHGAPKIDLDVMVVDIDTLLTDQGEDTREAQWQLMRNLLGMLAQKVCDVRQELFLLRDGRDMYAEAEPEKCLFVYTAGCAMSLVADTAEKWNKLHPELPAMVKVGGSVDLVRAVVAGDPCDVIVSADDKLFQDMLVPKFANGYTVFAGNRMVIVPTGEKQIDSNNWKEILLNPNNTFGHHDPYGDPGGYRAVMAMLLADNIENGLAEKLMNHKGHIGMDKNSKHNAEPDFMFSYASGPISRNKPFASLPAVMDLSDDNLAETYSKVSFAVDNKNTVTATPIAHAVTMPKTANHKESAQEFIDMLLSAELEKYGFLPRYSEVGKF